MTSVKDIIRYNIHQASEAIHAIKQQGQLKPHSADGHAMSDWKKYQDLKASASLNLTALKILKLTGGTIPETKLDFLRLLYKDLEKCGMDHKVKALAQAGLHTNSEELVRAILRARPSLSVHAPAGKAKSHAFKAYKLLRKIGKELDNHPKLFAHVAEWAAQREKEAAERKEERAAASA